MLAALRQAAAPQPLWPLLYGGLEPRLRLDQLTHTMQQSAQFALLRGVVALERGDVEPAARYVRLAGELGGSDRDVATVVAYYRQLLGPIRE